MTVTVTVHMFRPSFRRRVALLTAGAFTALAALTGLLPCQAIAGAPRELAYISSVGSVEIIDTATNEVIARLPTNDSVSVTPDGRWILRGPRSEAVEVIDAATLETAASIPVPGEFGARNIVGVDGATAYLSVEDGIRVLDIPSRTAPLLSLFEPSVMTVAPNGEHTFAIDPGDGNVAARLARIDNLARSIIESVTLGPPGFFTGMTVSPDGRLYILERATNTIYGLRARDFVIQTFIPTDRDPLEIAVTSGGTSAYVTHRDGHMSVIDLVNRATVERIALPHVVGRIALTGDRQKLYALHPDNCSASVIDVPTRSLITTFAVGEDPSAIEIVPAAGPTTPAPAALPSSVTQGAGQPHVCAYVTHSEQRITVIDAEAHTVLGGFPLESPARVALSPEGTRAYVTHQANNRATGAVAVLDTATNEQIGGLILGSQPLPIEISDDGATAFVGLLTAPCSALLNVDTAAGTIRRRYECEPCSQPLPRDSSRYVLDLAKSNDGRVFVLIQASNSENFVLAVDVASGETLASIPLPQQPSRAAITPDSRKLYITFASGPEAAVVIDTTTYSLTKFLEVTGGATTVGMRPDGQVVYFAHSSIEIVDTATDEVIGSIAPGLGDNIGSIDFTPDGAFAYAVGPGVAVIDTVANAVVKTLPLPSYGQDIAVGVFANGCATPPAPPCTGDCDGDRSVSVDELVNGVNTVLGTNVPCPAFDFGNERGATVADLLAAVDNAVRGCPTAF